jgi:hypothetical protein
VVPGIQICGFRGSSAGKTQRLPSYNTPYAPPLKGVLGGYTTRELLDTGDSCDEM